MQPTDFIGFIISLLALGFLFFRNRYEKRYQQEHPKEYAERQKKREQALKEYSKLMGVPNQQEEDEDIVEEVVINPYKPKPTTSFTMPPKNNQPEERINAPLYEVHRKRHSSVGRSLIEALPSKQRMLIYKEIFDKPVAMRDP